MTEPRTPCHVVGCRRTIKGAWYWWICATHWRMVPMSAKARYRKAKRLALKSGDFYRSPQWWGARTERGSRIHANLKEMLVRAANGAACGL